MNTMDIIEYGTLEPIIRSVERTNVVTILPQSLVTSKMSKVSLPKDRESIHIHFVVQQESAKKKQ
jgi:hypothetical protein